MIYLTIAKLFLQGFNQMVVLLRERKLIDLAQKEVLLEGANELIELMEYSQKVDAHYDDLSDDLRNKLRDKYKSKPTSPDGS